MLTFINNCQTKTLCNIEIVSAYISDEEYKQLNSYFYSITTKNEYDTLQEVLNNIADHYSLTLRK